MTYLRPQKIVAGGVGCDRGRAISQKSDPQAVHVNDRVDVAGDINVLRKVCISRGWQGKRLVMPDSSVGLVYFQLCRDECVSAAKFVSQNDAGDDLSGRNAGVEDVFNVAAFVVGAGCRPVAVAYLAKIVACAKVDDVGCCQWVRRAAGGICSGDGREVTDDGLSGRAIARK